MTYFKPQI